jgi:hypothetical protein
MLKKFLALIALCDPLIKISFKLCDKYELANSVTMAIFLSARATVHFNPTEQRELLWLFHKRQSRGNFLGRPLDMSSSSKRARLRYAESTSDSTHVPDTYSQRRKEVQKVTERIENDHNEEFDDISDVDNEQSPENAAIEEAFDTYNALRYFIYNASLSSSSKANVPRICFLHQLYSILPDNTAVDRELVSPKEGGSCV